MDSSKPSAAAGLAAAEFDAIIEAAVDGIIVIDRGGAIEAFNPGAERIFGYSAAQVMGRNIAMLMPEPDATAHDNYIARYLAGGSPRIIGQGRQVEGLRYNGEVFPMELSVGEARTSDGVRFVGIVKDITARSATETALEQSERQHRILFDHAPVGIFTADPDGRFLSMNGEVLALLGLGSAQDLDGQTCISLAPVTDRAVVAAAFADLTAPGTETASCRTRWQTADRAAAIVDLRLTLVDEAGEAPFIIGHAVDRTHELEAENRLRAAQQQLAQVGRVTTLGEMASAIAHEINQPLTAISAYAQACRRLLDANQSDAKTIRDSFESIYSQSMRAGEVVHRIRAFVRDRESMRKREDINEIIDSTIALARFDIDESGVELELGLTRPLPLVTVDRVQIQQVCLNLIRNAIDALSASAVSERLIQIESAATADGIAVRVRDTGPGVDPEQLQLLFQPFHTTRDHGMGIGLSISHSIINAHEGRLVYAAASSGGAIFTFELPAVNQHD